MSCTWHQGSIDIDVAKQVSSDLNAKGFDDSKLMFGEAIARGRDAAGKNEALKGWKLSKTVVNNLMSHMLVAASPGIYSDETTNPHASDTPAGLTYLGQMITHDIVPDTEGSKNPRRADPQLNLSSLYWPASRLSDPDIFDPEGRFILRAVEQALDKDLPRNEVHAALIPEQRNDENTIVSQLHVLWLSVHNKAIELILAKEAAGTTRKQRYQWAQNFVILLFQNIVVNEFLKSILHPKVFDMVFLDKESFVYSDSANDSFEIPREFSDAVFRFGHSMIKQGYKIKKGSEAETSLNLIVNWQKPLEKDLLIDWERFFAISSIRPQAASTVNLQMASGLSHIRVLQKTVEKNLLDYSVQQQKTLAVRNKLVELLLSSRNLLSKDNVVDHFTAPDKETAEHLLNKGVVGFKNIILRDIQSSKNVPTGNELNALMRDESYVGSNSGVSLVRKAGLITQVQLEKALNFKSSTILNENIGMTLSASNAPLWLFTLREAEEFPFTDGYDGNDSPNVSANKLGAVSSVVIAEVMRQSILKSEINIYQNWSDSLAPRLGPLRDKYLDLVSGSKACDMAKVFKFLQPK